MFFYLFIYLYVYLLYDFKSPAVAVIADLNGCQWSWGHPRSI